MTPTETFVVMGLKAQVHNLETLVEKLKYALAESKDAEFCAHCGELLIKGHNIVDEFYCSTDCKEDCEAGHSSEMAFQESIYQKGR